MLGNILLNENLSLRERTRFLSLATLILALTSGVFIAVTTQVFQNFQPEAITHFAIYGVFFALVRNTKFVNQVGGFVPFAFLGTLIYFYLLPEAHEFIKVWGNVGLIFILFTVKEQLRKWMAGLVVLLICGATTYYHVEELVGIIPVRLAYTNCSAAFCAFIATYFLNIYDHRFKELTQARDEAETFRKVVENIPIKVYLVSKNGEIKFINAAVSKYLGYSKNELVGKNLSKVSMGNDYAHLLQLLEQKSEGEILCKEVEGKSKNGRIVHNELCASLINYEGK